MDFLESFSDSKFLDPSYLPVHCVFNYHHHHHFNVLRIFGYFYAVLTSSSYPH